MNVASCFFFHNDDNPVIHGHSLSHTTSSDLPRKTLHEIWNVADARNEGRLDFSAFCVACRLAAHAQQGLPVSAESVNQDPVAPLQLFGSARPTPTTSPKMASSSSSTGQQVSKCSLFLVVLAG